MDTPHRILVPTDLSDRSTRAVAFAAMVARCFDATLVAMINVNMHERAELEDLAMADGITVEAAGQTALRRILTEHAPDTNTEIVVVFEAFPAEAILTTAASRNIDMIVIASHGRSGMTRWMLGSIAEKVVRVADVPVTVVPVRD